jgi:glycosyltransferase involved in cell wall biosynthesis
MTSDSQAKALEFMRHNRVAVFIVAYNAEKHIGAVLKRIPDPIARNLAEIYVIDDSSTDRTLKATQETPWPAPFAPMRIFRTPFNQGYGGNQKLGYAYALRSGFDVVVLLHGDGQYAPESLPDVIAPFQDGYDAVFGSRFLDKGKARRGGMPLYKRFGNKVLTGMQNRLLGTRMSEMHSGYRAYRVSALRRIPFRYNSNDFHFDAEIILQLHAWGLKIKEVPIPTYYGGEICHVNGMRYAWNCLRSFARYRLMQMEIFYDPKYDVPRANHERYAGKEAPTSVHAFVRRLSLPDAASIVDLGGGDGRQIARFFTERHAVLCVDRQVGEPVAGMEKIAMDLDGDWREIAGRKFDAAFALDVLEHLRSPEQGAGNAFRLLRPGGRLYASTGNVSYFVIRLMHLFGVFNYGRRGILDLTHTRLLTRKSFSRLLAGQGFRVERMIGFGPPIRDLKKGSRFFRALDALAFGLARAWPSLFAYQLLAVCSRPDDIDDLMPRTFPG